MVHQFDGQYFGTWGGHVIEFWRKGEIVRMLTDLGVRGRDRPVRFRVTGGEIDESSIVILDPEVHASCGNSQQ